jgi:aminomethyltransferase
MNMTAYTAITSNYDYAGIYVVQDGFLDLKGQDRGAFLQGQVSNDVLAFSPGQNFAACLLNSTGHLLALLDVYVFPDSLLVGTDSVRGPIVLRSLNRYLVRERVSITESPMAIITVQGAGSTRIVSALLRNEAGEEVPIVGFRTYQIPQGEVTVVARKRYTASVGYDLIVSQEHILSFRTALLSIDGAFEVDVSTAEVLRVESGEPAWTAELDESIIPLEAELDNAISYTKGCYVGQEIIARIHSRGHTNRRLAGLSLDRLPEGSVALTAADGEKIGQEVGRITSAVISPRFGTIALAYVRNEFAQVGTLLATENGSATVAPERYMTAIMSRLKRETIWSFDFSPKQ